MDTFLFVPGKFLRSITLMAIVLASGSTLARAQCDDVAHPGETPYPEVTPPPEAQGNQTLPVNSESATFEVATGSELLAAIDAASAGDTIVLTAQIVQYVDLTKSGLKFKGAGASRVQWRGPSGQNVGYGDWGPVAGSAVQVESGVSVTFENLALWGGYGLTYDQYNPVSDGGGRGAEALTVITDGTVLLINCSLSGGSGGEGYRLDNCGGSVPGYYASGDGGRGAASWLAYSGSYLYADLQCSFQGGGGGTSPSDNICCVPTGLGGDAALPKGPTEWVEFTAPFGNAAARAQGDFDASGCTDLTDFLLLLDAWQTDVGGSKVAIADFLAVIDNWQSGAGCP